MAQTIINIPDNLSAADAAKVKNALSKMAQNVGPDSLRVYGEVASQNGSSKMNKLANKMLKNKSLLGIKASGIDVSTD